MSLVIGHTIIDGVPYINGKAAIPCPKGCKLEKLMEGALAPWLCPECDAHLSGESLICMNGCHLSAASMRRFNSMLSDAAAKQRKKDDGSK